MASEDVQNLAGPASPDSNKADSPMHSSHHDTHDLQHVHALARNPPPGATVYPPAAAVSSALNPRSCVTCRRRKVRCDKHMPCANCRRAQIPCIFPAPGRAPRRPRPKDPNAPPKHGSSEREMELMKRLRKLEGIVEELSGQIELEATRHPSSAGDSPEAHMLHDTDGNIIGSNAPMSGHRASSVAGSSQSQGSPTAGTPGATIGRSISVHHSSHSASKKPGSSDSHDKTGRLILNDKGVTRYVSSGFWSKVNDELDEIRRETQKFADEESEESETETSPESMTQEKGLLGHQAFIFGYRSADVDLRPLHPLPSQIPFMWQMYQENVDPMVKILHLPTMNKLVREVRNNLNALTPSTEALMFAIYYAAITSMEEEEVKTNFGADKEFLISQYRFALEQALAQANFLTAPDLALCQAFVLFLGLTRRQDNTRFTWTLTGLIIRLSQAIGLHRDGTNFPSLKPFEIEMRRRVFWAILVLDLRAAEDQGTDVILVDGTFDTQMPLNINDADIDPESTEIPESRIGPTDVTFSLIRNEICSLGRRLHTATSAMTSLTPRTETPTTIEEQEEMLQETNRHIGKVYLSDAACEDNPIFWAATNIARLIVAKMTLLIYQPVMFPGSGNENLSTDTRDRVFMAAIELFEYGRLLTSDIRFKSWRWLFHTYTHWHAVAYILIEVSHRPWSATVERAWMAVGFMLTTPKPEDVQTMAENSAVWVPYKRLFLRAKKHRELEIARLRADPQAAQQLDLEECSKVPRDPETFTALPHSVKTSIALDRWRKLVNAPPLPPDMTSLFQPADQLNPLGKQNLVATGSAGTQPHRPQSDQGFDRLVGETMSNPPFNFGDSFLPLAWGQGTPDSAGLARSAIFGLDAGNNMPIRNQSPPSSAAAISGASSGAHPPSAFTRQGQQAMLSPLDDPPPFLWSSVAGEMSRNNDNLDVPVDDLDNMDINMDEGFDWQNWQENLGKIELENGGGPSGGVWGYGI